jgi:replicative DNA helicase
VGSDLASQLVRDLSEQPGTYTQDIIERFNVDFAALTLQGSAGDDDAVSAPEAAKAALAALEARRAAGGILGLRTGLTCFDDRIGGLQSQQLVCVAGRTSMGKTGLARSAAYGAARLNPGAQILFFSLEMAAKDIALRSLSDDWHTSSSTGALAYNKLHTADRQERARLEQIADDLPPNLLVIDRAGLSVADIRRRVFAAKRKGLVAAVFVDHLGFVRPDPASKGKNESGVVGDKTAALLQLAKDAKLCVVMLSQMNREADKREGNRPQLSDLRDSGSIEQDSHAVLMVYRQAYYLARKEPQDGNSSEWVNWNAELCDCAEQMEVICTKNRNGPVGSDMMTYRAEYDSVTNRASGGRP